MFEDCPPPPPTMSLEQNDLPFVLTVTVTTVVPETFHDGPGRPRRQEDVTG